MTEAVTTCCRIANANDVRAFYEPVAQELEGVEEILRTETHSDHPFIDRLSKHGFRLGGKRLRPALVLLSAQACGRIGSEHLLLGAAMELIHTATLIHDDVLDDAVLRRHLETVNALWDNETSVLLGDYLFARSIHLVSSLDSTFACRAIGDATQVMCEGELRQVEFRGHFDLDEDGYLQIIEAKTAALCACCCRVGAHFAGAAPDAEESLARFGRCLGIAFQITDDILDVTGDESVAGKSLGTDLVKKKPTLPLIHVLQRAGHERGSVIALLSGAGNHPRETLRPWFQRYDAIAYAREKARSYADQAKQELCLLPSSRAREMLVQIADFIVNRKQ